MPKTSSGGMYLRRRRYRGHPRRSPSRADARDHVAKPDYRGYRSGMVWLEGDADVFGAGEPIKGVASEIVTILTENEEEEPARAG